jgi:hypothetical protein
MVEIKELASLSTTLNQKSDKLNATISAINEKLEKLNFGTEVTLSAGTAIEYGGEQYVLGYEKHPEVIESASGHGGITNPNKQKWQLSVHVVSREHSKRLLDAPREVRIAALDLIPELLSRMKEKAERLISSMDRAEQLAENL